VIGSLRGSLLERSPGGELLIEVGGVGYRVTVPLGALAAVGEPGSPVFVHVHTHVREDALILYGFPTRDERGCFEALITTHGVGPALALAILSVHGPASLRRAVATDDVEAMTMVPGVGRKTAARLLLELKAKLEVADDDDPLTGLPGIDGGALSEVRVALSGLGYGPDEVRAAVRELPPDGTVEDLLRSALKQLAGAR
jgi:Holliday junction DNA helicase RuvA